jgi:hypothetical protein
VFETRVLRKVFWPQRDEVTGDLRILHNKKLHDVYSTSSTIRVMKSRRMLCAGRVVFTGDRRSTCRILVGKAEERYHLENVGVDGRITLK